MKYFIDTSSLVKIYHPEIGTEAMLKIYNTENIIRLSELSIIEFLTTIHRKYREREINDETLQVLIDKFNDDANVRYQVLKFTSFVTGEARSIIQNIDFPYPLKTLDCLQFAFFRTYCEKDTVFITSDKNLAKRIELEGFQIQLI